MIDDAASSSNLPCELPANANMIWIPAGTFRMGSEGFYPEERPVHEVAVDGFWIDRYALTNERFARFVSETGYVTVAERRPDPKDFPGAPLENLVPGSMVFRKSAKPVDLRNYANWWAWVPGADWRHPLGPKSSLKDLEQHPVVHVAFEDAEAYASGRVKSCRRNPNGSTPRAAGSRARRSPGVTNRVRMAGDGQHLARRVSLAESAGGCVRGHVASRFVSTERLWPIRHGRQHLGVDLRLVGREACGRGQGLMLRPSQ